MLKSCSWPKLFIGWILNKRALLLTWQQPKLKLALNAWLPLIIASSIFQSWIYYVMFNILAYHIHINAITWKDVLSSGFDINWCSNLILIQIVHFVNFLLVFLQFVKSKNFKLLFFFVIINLNGWNYKNLYIQGLSTLFYQGKYSEWFMNYI